MTQIIRTGEVGFDKFDKRELAIMSKVCVGVDDRDRVSLMFELEGKFGNASMWFELEDTLTLDFILAYGRTDVKNMSGLPVWVINEDHMVKYVWPKV